MTGIAEGIAAIAAYLGAGAYATAIGYAVTAVLVAAYVGYSIYAATQAGSGRASTPTIGDSNIQFSHKGTPLYRLWGTMRVAGNLIEGYKYSVSHEDDGGGKGKGDGVEQTTYFAHFAVALCEARPGSMVKRIWLNNKIWYDPDNPENEEPSLRHFIYFRYYDGTQTTSDPTIEQLFRQGHTTCAPVYAGVCLIVFNSLDLTNFAGSIPSVNVEIADATEHENCAWLPKRGFAYRGFNTVQDPRPGTHHYIWMATYDTEEVVVYDRTFENIIATIPLPHDDPTWGIAQTIGTQAGNPHAQSVGNGLCFVEHLDEVWVLFKNDYYAVIGESLPSTWYSAAIYDANTYEYKDSMLLIGHDLTSIWYSRAGGVVVIFSATTYGSYRVDPAMRKISWETFPDLHWINSKGNDCGRANNGYHGGVPILGGATSFMTGAINPIGKTGYGVGVSLYGDHLYIVGEEVTDTYHREDYWPDPPNPNSQSQAFYDPLLGYVVWSQFYSTQVVCIPFNIRYRTAGVPFPRELPVMPVCGLAKWPGYVWITNGPQHTYIINSQTMELIREVEHDPNDMTDPFGGSLSSGATTTTYPYGSSIVLGESGVFRHAIDYGTWVPLSTIVTDLCAEAGIVQSDIDVSELEDVVWGYVRSKQMTAQDALMPLMIAYSFDAVESDNILWFRKRHFSPDMELDVSQLACHSYGSETPAALQVTKLQDTELPKQVTVNYVSPAIDYQQGSQTFQTEVNDTENKLTQDLPICMTAGEGRAIAFRLWNLAWIEQYAYSFKADYGTLELTPCDVVLITEEGTGHLMRISKVTYGSPGIVEYEAIAVRVPYLSGEHPRGFANPYVPPVSIIDYPDDWIPTPPPIPTLADTGAFCMNLPCLRTEDNNPGYYWGLYPTGGSMWNGGELLFTRDGGDHYTSIGTSSTPVIHGYPANTLPYTPQTYVPDSQWPLDVYIATGSLESCTDEALWNNSNLAAYGSASNGWELIQYGTATLIAPHTYRLTRLMRGRFGTEYLTGSHAPGDRFVLVTSTSGRVRVEDIGWLNIPTEMLTRSIGQSLEEGLGFSFTDTCERLRPYAPCHPSCYKIRSTGELRINFRRRGRWNNIWTDETEVPIGEDRETYRVTFLDDDENALFTATYNDTRRYLFSVADQILYYGEEMYSTRQTVQQYSYQVGWGHPITFGTNITMASLGSNPPAEIEIEEGVPDDD
jgi:hypothetical protein